MRAIQGVILVGFGTLLAATIATAAHAGGRSGAAGWAKRPLPPALRYIPGQGTPPAFAPRKTQTRDAAPPVRSTSAVTAAVATGAEALPGHPGATAEAKLIAVDEADALDAAQARKAGAEKTWRLLDQAVAAKDQLR